MYQLKKIKTNRIVFALALVLVAMISCVKNEGLSAADQSKADEELIQKYLTTHKLDSTATHPPSHINWEIVLASVGDSTLADIADTVTSVINGVEYYTYFIDIEEGKNSESGESKDLMVADYREYLLDGKELSSSIGSNRAIEMEISSRIEGLRQGLKLFFTGVRPEGDSDIDYRKDIEVPGRGIIFFPSGLGYGELGNKEIAPNQPLRVDLVLYEKKNFPEVDEE